MYWVNREEGETMIDIYGTIGPACADPGILKMMFQEGMTGIRLNTSHVSLREAEAEISMIHGAAAAIGIEEKLLIDMQGPELRIGKMEPVCLEQGDRVLFLDMDSYNPPVSQEYSGICNDYPDEQERVAEIPVSGHVLEAFRPGMEVLLDDGKILLQMEQGENATALAGTVLRGGVLKGGKSIALQGAEVNIPAMTEQDKQNLADAAAFGVTGVMQPFVRSAEDLWQLREYLDQVGGKHIRILAKIENLAGVRNLESFFPVADEIVIARGDLGNAVPLWELPALQKDIERRCLAAGVPFMVVTQMLASMEHSAVPTRAEVSDIYNAVYHGAASVMVTGETAVGEYPVEVIRYLAKTVQSIEKRDI